MNALRQTCASSPQRAAHCLPLAAASLGTALQPRAAATFSRRFGTSARRAFQAASRQPAHIQTRGLSAAVAAFGMRESTTELAPKTAPAGQDIATFAGGCFWGLELAYQREPGVAKTSVGYTQGDVQGPSYQAVCSGRTGHTEAVQVYYDPKEVSYERLVELFFERVDPTTKDRQGNDSGSQYRSGIYYHDDSQKNAAEAAIAAVNDKLKSSTWRRVLGSQVVTELKPTGDYWLAEKYHQQYLQKGGQNAEKNATDRIRCYG